MANNNVQNVKFLRNSVLFGTRELALTGIQTEFNENVTSAIFDGTAILARYGSGNDVKTLVGYIYFNGANKSLTVIDVDGAAANVQELREEIEAKLGNGVTSGNTVTAQLAALSGNNQSTSADTSVEGAKRYADELINVLDYTDAAVAGEYVSQVSQADGKIAVVRTELPSFDDGAVAKKFVIAVDETKGLISTTKGTISSTGETIVLTDNADGGVNFEVHYDGTTIIQDPTTKELKVASSALIQYVGDEDTIHISEVAGDSKTVSSLLTISATTPSEANVKEQYNLVGASGNTIGATIKIYKDSALLSVALLHADTTANPQVLPTYDKATDTWTDIPSTAQTEANQALCYAYEDVSGNTVVAAVPVGSFINEQEFASGVTWDSTANKVKGVVDPTSESFLTVGENGFKISGVSGLVTNAIEDLDATVTGATSGNHVTISIEELDGKLVQSGLTIEENDIASAADLAALSAKTVTEIGSSNSSIAVSTSATTAADGTVKYDVITDASKIQMSGFTSQGVLSGITPASSITEAFGEVEDVIEENERVTSNALNDINSRINTLSGSSLSGVSVNGTAVTVSDNVAPIVINSATSATTATSTEAITVTTNANGNVTLGLASIDCGTY